MELRRFGLTVLLALGVCAFGQHGIAATYTENTAGPVDYTRERGKPRIDELSVPVPYPLEHTEYTLILKNRTESDLWDRFMAWLQRLGVGIDPFRRPVPVQVAVNDDPLFPTLIVKEPLEKQLELAPEDNRVRLRLFGKPGGKLRARVRAVVTDNERPAISPVVDPQANDAGWHDTEPTVSFDCSDQITGIDSCTDATTLSEGADQTVEGTARDLAGNESTASVTLDVDLTSPELGLALTPEPNTAGWQNQAVTADFSCSDNLSGVVQCPESVTFDTEGADQAIERQIRDKAGHTASASASFGLDFTKPVLNASLSPAANDNGWHAEPPYISYSCSDTLSGVVDCPADTNVTEPGEGRVIPATVSDQAGNSTAVETVVNLDTTAPTVTANPARPANDAGWYNEAVRVAFSCNDDLSGVANCPGSQTIDQEGRNQSVSVEIADLAGNTAQASQSISLDQTGPTIEVNASPAANDADWHSDPVTLSYSCTDALSGVADCPADQTLDTDGANQSITAEARDSADNTASVTSELNIDTTAPNLAFEVPQSGAELVDTRPTFTLQVSDNLALDADALQVTVGSATLSDCSMSDGKAICTPSSDLPRGEVTATATVADKAGNQRQVSVDFLIQVDRDGDGVLDTVDQCPNTEPGRAVGEDGCDPTQRDTDGDGVLDINDAFPHDPDEWSDLDGDGTGNNSDSDRDGDGIADGEDQFADNPNEWADFDGDGVANNSDPDRDGDGTANGQDPFPQDPTRSSLPVVTIDSPQTLSTVGSSPVEVIGTVDTAAESLTVNGTEVSFDSQGNWSANVHLDEGHNTISARMVDSEGLVSTASIALSLDMTPPHLTVESHRDGQRVFTDTVTLSGLVNDLVRGTVEADDASVTVNGVTADIRNRSYQAKNVPLEEGANTVTVRATDHAGNVGEKQITLHYAPSSGERIKILGGQGQQAEAETVLPGPLRVQVLNENGEPAAGESVVFRVTRGNGVVGVGTDAEAQAVLIDTDSQGIAETSFRVGERAGLGTHKVRATVVGYEGKALFQASVTPGTPAKVSVNSGNNQRGAVYRPLPSPFVVTVTDAGANLIEGARVRFRVVEGGGAFRNGEATVETTTDRDGRAFAQLKLGNNTGLDRQRVVTTLVDGPEGENITAGFTASAFHPGPAGETSISGVVVNNQGQPLPGVTVRVDGTSRKAVADKQGHFTIENAPVGPVHLIADGSTADAEGEYPSLSYNLVTVSGVNNPLPAPVYMVKLNEKNKVHAGPNDAVVTLDKMPGFKLEIPAGSVTFPDGSREGYVSVTTVNANKVPMPPPDGLQPNLVVTIQPTGAKFDPPAKLTLPNVDGHQPGTQARMISYDHDLEEFVTIGLGTVSKGGRVIESNPGVGVVKAGWHASGQPNPTGDGEGNDCEGKPEKCIKSPSGGGDPGQCPAAEGGSGTYNDKQTGNPVNILNGNKFQRETDYVGNGPFPLRVEHTYNSQYGGWRHAYEYSVEPLNDFEYRELMDIPLVMFSSGSGGSSTIKADFGEAWYEPKYRLLTLADGKQVVFQESETEPGLWQNSSHPHRKLEEKASGYIYTNTRSGRTLTFDGQGRVTKIENRAGREQTLHYSDGQVRVNDELGNTLTLNLNKSGQMKSAQVGGLEFNYKFDGEKLTEAIYPDGTSRQYLYENDEFGYLTGIVDEAGNRVATWRYGKYGKVIVSKHAGGADRKLIRYNRLERNFDLQFSLDGSGSSGGGGDSVTWRTWHEEPEVGSVTVTNELDRVTTYHFERINGERRITRVEGDATPNCPSRMREKTFTSQGLIKTETDWNGTTTRYAYDSGGRMIRQTEAVGTPQERTRRWDHDPETARVTRYEEPGRTVKRSYNADGRLTERTVGERTWTYTYYDSGLLKSIDGPREDVDDITKFTYDASGNRTSVTNALGQTTELKDHNAWNLPQTIIDPNGVKTELSYDSRGRLTKSTLKSRAGDAVTQYEIDDRGLVTAITPPNGATIHYEYDTAERLTAIANDSGDRIEYSLDAMGNRTEEKVIGSGGELARIQRRLHDAAGRLLEQIGARGQSTRYDYDANGNATAITDPRGNRIQQAFDPLDRLHQSQDPYQKTVTFEYDPRDNLTSVTDQRGLTTRYEHNQHNQVTKRTSPDTGVTTFSYDDAGNIATRTDARGVTAEYSHDALNRLKSVHYPDDPSRDITYTYDQHNTGSGVAPEDYNAGIGRLTQLEDHSGTTSFRYDDRGNLFEDQRTVQVAGSPYTYSVRYQYNLAGQVTAMTYPDGTEINYSYNAEGEVSSIDGDIAGDMLDTNLASNIRYQPFGPVEQLTWGNGLTLSRTFDQDGRIQSQTIPGVQDLDYGFDPNSNITRISDGIDPSDSAEYDYDKINRLSREVTEDKERDYNYDGVGNRTEQVITDKTKGSTTTEDYSYGDTSNRLMAVNEKQYQYDAVGNTIQDGEFSYSYDVTNRMSSVSQNGSSVANYRYNAQGQRVVKHRTGRGNTKVFAYNRKGQLVSEVTFDADREIIDRKHYVWLRRMPVAQLQPAANDSDYEVLYLHADHLNTPRKATNADQTAVWEWKSEAFGSDGANSDPDGDGVKAHVNLRFPGQYYDGETEKHYNYFRYYDGKLGRYIVSDPIGLKAGVNTYAYVTSNPVTAEDPYGLVEIGNCDVNWVSGKITCKTPGGSGQCTFTAGDPVPESCSGTIGNKKNSCDVDTEGNVECQGTRGPLQCTITYDAESEQFDWTAEPVIPGADGVKAQYEALKFGAEIAADHVEAGAQKLMDARQKQIDDAVSGDSDQ